MSATCTLLLALQFFGIVEASEAVPRLSSDAEVATAGFFQLNWTASSPDAAVELQQADNPAFTHASFRYRGPDRASVISGMPDGQWYYRVRNTGDKPGPWSETVAVKVAHHPLTRAFLFFGMGVAVFLATLWLIVQGSRRAR